MLTMVIFKTKADEAKLFLKLFGRGRHADIPYYQSVETYSEDAGVVTFCRLDCAPAQPYKVGVAGNEIITSESFASEIESWLKEWRIKFTSEKKQVGTKEAAQELFAQMRKATESDRRAMLEKIKKGMEKIFKARDREDRAMCQMY